MIKSVILVRSLFGGAGATVAAEVAGRIGGKDIVMRRHATLCIALAAVVRVPMALAQGYPTEGQLLANPGFDLDATDDGVPDGWGTTPERALLREKVFMGRDRELVSVGETYVLATQPVTLEPGETYTLGFSARGKEGGLAGALMVHGKERPTREMPLLWRVEVEGEYATYWKSFTAPNPVAVLYLYNVARKGQVAYDWVSLVKGELEQAYVRQVSLGERDRPNTEPVARPFRPWGGPLAGGPIRALFSLYRYATVSEVVALSRRLELDYDVVEGGTTGQDLCSPTGNRLMRRLDAGEYEVYVIASRLDPAMEKGIREKVQAGAGLVVLSGFGRLKGYCEPDALEVAGDDHYLRRDLPWQFMPGHLLKEMRVGTLGEGRVAYLHFPLDLSRVWGIWPVENDKAAYVSRELRYWEYWHAFLARVLQWAARGECGVRLESAEGGTAPSFRVTGAPARAAVEVALRHSREVRFGEADLSYPSRSALVSRQPVAVDLPPQVPAGPLLVDVTVRDAQGRALYWGCLPGAGVPQTATIGGLALDKEHYEPGDAVRVAVEVGPAVQGLRLQARLVDAHGRLLCESVQPAASTTEINLAPAREVLLTAGHKLFVRLLDGDREVDSAWTDVYFPAVNYRRAVEDFHVTAWGDGYTNPVVSQTYSEMLLDLGFNGKFGSWPHATVERGLIPGIHPPAGHVFWPGAHKGDGVRNPCLSDPATIERYTTEAAEQLAPDRRLGIFAVNIQDEATLANRHERHEVCFSEHCQSRYRTWLREQYGDLAALNAEWETDYASFDQITGARTEDVRGTGNFAPFVDFRTFMTDVWVDGMRQITQAYKSAIPETRVGHTNTFGAMPTNGVDYYKLCTQCGFEWAQEYSEAIKGTAHKAVFELWRSFCPKDFPNYGWIGYDHRPEAVRYEPWWLALHGSRGVSYFATNSLALDRGKSWALIHPTQAYTPYSRDVKAALTDLHEGVGKLLMEYERVEPDVALLWSHPSMLVAWCESEWTEPVPPETAVTEAYGSYFKSAFHFRLLLNELQLTCNYVAPPQVLNGELSKYKVLFLPFTAALSDEVIDALLEWVGAGGTLMADMCLARTDEHGRFRDTATLERLMAVRRTEATASYGLGEITVRSDRQFETSARETIEPVGNAEVLGKHADGTPALVKRRLGKGTTIYLNCLLPKYDANAVAMLESLLTEAEVARSVRVATGDAASPARAWECNRFRRGDIEVVGLIRDHRLVEGPQTAAVDFGRIAHVYDVRARQYLGETREIEPTLGPGEARVYGLLPYRVTGIRVTTDGTAFTAKVQADGTVGDHVLRLTVTDPQGNTPRAYERNVLATGGKYEGTVPFALNDPAGEWTLTVRDVLSGAAGTAKMQWRPAGE